MTRHTPARDRIRPASRRIGLLVLGVFLLLTGVASADQLEASSELLVERKHTVQLSMFPGYARLVVRRTVFNGSKGPGEARFTVDLPEGAVAVGLRTRRRKSGGPRWIPGSLLRVQVAAERYQQLSDTGAGPPRDPALLAWENQSTLSLRLFPCMPGKERVVEYTLLVPTVYQGGVHRLTLPAPGTDQLSATLSAEAGRKADVLRVDGKSGPHGIRFVKGEVKLELTESPGAELSGSLGSFSYQAKGALTRLRVQAAPKLGSVPKDAQIVIVLDTSRSLSEQLLQQHAEAASAYLSHFQGGRVQVLTFDRAVWSRYPGFVSVKRARADLAKPPPPRRNGSRPDLALSLARGLLADRPGPTSGKRIVIFTDALTRSSLSLERIGAGFAIESGIVHVAVADSAYSTLRRYDDHDWSTWVQRTGGVVWSGGVAYSEPQARRKALEELARPIRLHQLKVSTPAGHRFERPADETLAEGEGFVVERLEKTRTAWVRVEGKAWTVPVAATLRPGSAANRRAAALAVGSDLLDTLNDRALKSIARKGRAVSRVTSYLALDPRSAGMSRPTEEEQLFGVGLGLMGVGTSSGCGWSTGARKPVFPQRHLEAKVSALWTRCGGQGLQGRVQIETTGPEVVRVRVSEPTEPSLQRCVEAGVWDLELPASLTWYRDHWTVTP